MRHPFCCPVMAYHMYSSNIPLIKYIGHTRKYLIVDAQGDGIWNYCEYKYCFNCGRVLPPNLEKEWLETLEKEYGITDPLGKDRNRIPREFRSDKWWKKRDL
jgi:hypothetical protein